MQKWEYTNRKDFVVGGLDVLGHDAPSDNDMWTTILVFGLERAFYEPILVVVDDIASTPSVLARKFVDNEDDLAAAQNYLTSCFKRNSGKEEKDKPARFYSMMPNSLFTESGAAKEEGDEHGYVIASVDEDYVCEFFGGKIARHEA